MGRLTGLMRVCFVCLPNTNKTGATKAQPVQQVSESCINYKMYTNDMLQHYSHNISTLYNSECEVRASDANFFAAHLHSIQARWQAAK